MVRLLISTGEVSGDLRQPAGAALHRQASLGGSIWRCRSVVSACVPRSGTAGGHGTDGGHRTLEALPLVPLGWHAWTGRQRPDGVVLINYGRRASPAAMSGCRTFRSATSLPTQRAWPSVMVAHELLSSPTHPGDLRQKRNFTSGWGLKSPGGPSSTQDAGPTGRADARAQLGAGGPGQLLLFRRRGPGAALPMPVLVEAAARLQHEAPSLGHDGPAGLEQFEQPLREALAAAVCAPDSRRSGRWPQAVADAAADLAQRVGTVNLELALQGFHGLWAIG